MKQPVVGEELGLVDIANMRAGVYYIFARSFYIPDRETTSPEFIQEIDHVFNCLGMNTDIGKIVQMINRPDYITEIKVDFAKLFHGPGKLLAPPYESLYRDGNLVMGDSAVAVMGFYRQAGYELDEQYTNLPDHISAELEFLKHLCQREAVAREQKIDAGRWLQLQKKFYEQHLSIWVEQFCAKTTEAARTTFYREMALLLRDWTLAEIALLNSMDE